MSRETALVTADWVAENLNNPSVVIVEVDEDTALYAQGHIENAITFNWREDLQDGLRRDVISKEGFEALLSRPADDTPGHQHGPTGQAFFRTELGT
jgi:thiosulfate/3-mercaptopyruvate sulfurtransferase